MSDEQNRIEKTLLTMTAIVNRARSASKAEVDFFSTSFKVPFPARSYAHLQHQSERDEEKALLTVMK